MKKILHLFSDPSHSALWSRYLRMLTLIALFAFGSHGVWGEETGTATESWAPLSASSDLTGKVHDGTNMSIDLVSTWQSVYVINRYAIKKGEGATYPDPLKNDYFTIRKSFHPLAKRMPLIELVAVPPVLHSRKSLIIDTHCPFLVVTRRKNLNYLPPVQVGQIFITLCFLIKTHCAIIVELVDGAHKGLLSVWKKVL